MAMKFKNNTEQLLAKLGDHTFLKLWSHSGLYMKPNEELCDLFVKYENDIICFEIKNFNGNIKNKASGVIWKRILKKIENSSDGAKHQLIRAEQHIKRYPRQIYKDVKCSIPFDMGDFNVDVAKIYKVAVIMGCDQLCESYHKTTNSLKINTKTEDLFTISNYKYRGRHINIFDSISFIVVMTELSTFSDFVDYLKFKEDILGDADIVANNELDLLALYIDTINGWRILKSKVSGPYEEIYIKENTWNFLIKSDLYKERRSYFEASYYLDQYIDQFTSDDVEEDISFGLTTQQSKEELFKHYSLLPRRIRAHFANEILLNANMTLRKKERYFISGMRDNVTWAFGIVPFRHNKESEWHYYLRKFQLLVNLYLTCLKHYPKKQHFMGLVFDKIMIRKDGTFKFGKPASGFFMSNMKTDEYMWLRNKAILKKSFPNLKIDVLPLDNMNVIDIPKL